MFVAACHRAEDAERAEPVALLEGWRLIVQSFEDGIPVHVAIPVSESDLTNYVPYVTLATPFEKTAGASRAARGARRTGPVPGSFPCSTLVELSPGRCGADRLVPSIVP